MGLKGPYPLDESAVARQESADSSQWSKFNIKLVKYGKSANDYIPTGGSALESADSELGSADSSADSNADPPKIGVSVRALNL